MIVLIEVCDRKDNFKDTNSASEETGRYTPTLNNGVRIAYSF